MPFKVRRIVAQHDANGKSVIGMDSLIEASPGKSQSIENAAIWLTDTWPIENTGNKDPVETRPGLHPAPGGTIFRILELKPGTAPYMHRTDTLDYVLLLEGEVDMLVDDSEVHMKAGDVMVQRGTWHGWTNRSDKPCKIAFILIDAKKH